LLTSTPSRPRHHVGRTIAFVVVAVAVVAALLGAGYAVTRGSTPTATPTPTSTTTGSNPAPAPTSAASPSAVAFVALPVGTPPSLGVGEATYPWHQLRATLHGPHQITPGATSDFQVRLSNPTKSAITLDPCPSYDLTVGVESTSFGLNCDGAPTSTIGPGQSMTFDVSVAASHSLSSGSKVPVSWSLGWQPDATSPHARVIVTVK
jgi:hypothetical protein